MTIRTPVSKNIANQHIATSSTENKHTTTITWKHCFFIVWSLILFAICHHVVAEPLSRANNEDDTPTQSTAIQQSRVMYQALKKVNAYYVNEINNQALMNATLKAMMKNLDPHSDYLESHELNHLNEVSQGFYKGLGIEINEQDKRFIISHVFNDSPAALAGLQNKDELTQVNNQSTSNMTIDEVSKLIRNQQEKSIELTIRRAGISHLYLLSADIIPLQSVRAKMLNEHIAYIKVTSFQTKTATDLALALMKLNQEVAVQGILIDLRNNPGGVLDSAVDVSNLFLSAGKSIVTTKGRARSANQAFYSTEYQIFKGVPVAILINENSASASEIVAGALQVHDRAKIIGTTSYGKGSVQSLIMLDGGSSALKLTTAKYFTPDGKSIDGIGISPDISVTRSLIEQSTTARHNELEREDHQLLTATEFLTNSQ